MVEGFRVYGLGWSGFLGLVFQVLRDSLFLCVGGGAGAWEVQKRSKLHTSILIAL